jgi:HEAT repeat protein
MRLLRPTTIIAAFLIIAFSAPPSLFSQTAPTPSQSKQPTPPKRQTRRPQRADALSAAINELLKLDPILRESPDSNSPDTSERNEKPPGDDAPIRELIQYWLENRYAAISGAQKPSDRVRQRLLETVEDRPWLAHSLLELLPETPDTSDRLYRLINQEPDDEDGWKLKIHDWLSHNSGYFRDDLIAEVRSTDLGETQNAAALTSLSRLDWEAARPFIESYAAGNSEILAPTALSLLYEHEMKLGDAAKAESYRTGLKAMVANRKAPAVTRGAALSTLMATEWGGREEWFATLFADPSLSGQRGAKRNEPDGKEETKDATAKLDSPIRTAPNEYQLQPSANLLTRVAPEAGELILVVSSLVGHRSRTVHNAAVQWLVNVMGEFGDLKMRREVARKLLPWLTDPGWVDEGDRATFIGCFLDLELPESVAGLTWVLNFDESAKNRAAAAGSLAQFRNPSVNPALRRALEREEDAERRRYIVEALVDCGGFSDDEAAAAIEAYVKVAPDEGEEMDAFSDQSEDEKKPPPLEVSIGRIFSENLRSHFTEGLVVRLIERAKALRATQPKVARKILRVIEGLSLRAAEINLVERIGEGWADVDSITFAIHYSRDSLRKNAFDELNGLIKQGGYAAGVAAAILNDEREWEAMLEGRDAKAQLALLACARYLRDKLPVELAGRMLGSPNLSLAKAAESYLKVEDSAAARKLILARHPGEAYILGDNSSLDYFPSSIGVMKQWEEEMRREVKGQNGPEEIYALGHAYEPKTFTGAVIRIRGGKAEISVYEDPIRLNYRQLTPVELEELKSFTARQEVEDLGPEDVSRDWKYLSARGGSENPQLLYEYLRLNKDGGRRIAICSMRRAPKNPTLHEELGGLFHKLIDSGEFKVRYALEDKIPGLEVMWADKKQPVLSVCQEKGELRVLTGNPLAYFFKGMYAPAMSEWLSRAFAPVLAGRLKGDSEPALPEWRIFTKDGIGAVAPDTPACRRSTSVTFSPATSAVFQSIVGFYTQITISQGDPEEVYAVPKGKNQGVWKAEPGRDPVKLLDDAYQSVLALPDGKWLIGRKVINEGGKGGAQLVRHNLRTNEAFPIVFSREGDHRPLGFSEAHGKVLIVDGDDMSPQANGYLLDIETGATQAVSGDFRLIADDGIRNLQPAGKPNEFWAAIFDHQKQATIVGRYDAKLFAFTPLIQLPELRFDSSGAWVDQTAGMLWMVYRGCLLRLPLPK